MQYEEAAPRLRRSALHGALHRLTTTKAAASPVPAPAVSAMNTLAFLAPRTLPFLLTGEEFGALDRPSIHARCQPCDKGRRLLALDGREYRIEGVELEGNLFDRTREARQGWYRFFRELIALRKKHRPLTQGACEILDAGEEAPPAERTIVAFDRKLGHQLIRCAVNLGPEPRQLRRALNLFIGDPLHGRLESGGTLPPFGTVVVQVI